MHDSQTLRCAMPLTAEAQASEERSDCAEAGLRRGDGGQGGGGIAVRVGARLGSRLGMFGDNSSRAGMGGMLSDSVLVSEGSSRMRHRDFSEFSVALGGKRALRRWEEVGWRERTGCSMHARRVLNAVCSVKAEECNKGGHVAFRFRLGSRA
jgi:hypothetical protein